MQTAEVVLGVLRERGRKGLPLTQLYRQMFNKDLYLLAYGNIYSNQGAMTPGANAETADGMSEGKIDQIIEAMRHERYRFSPARRVYIPKKNGKLRPLGLPSVRTRKSCERAWQIAGVDSSRADAGDCPEWGQPGARGGVAQARRSPGLAVQGRNRSRAGPVRGFPPLRPHSSR
jgi:hypothetical protein